MEFNGKFEYKKIETNEDILQAYEIYRSNARYFYLVAGRLPELQDVGDDRVELPELVPESSKHFGIYSDKGSSVAVVDILEGYPEPDILYIGFFMIDGKLHRKGIGRELYDQIQEKAVMLGYRRVRLGVVEGNSHGMDFWKAMGFAEVDFVKTRSPYGQTWQVHVMEKTII